MVVTSILTGWRWWHLALILAALVGAALFASDLQAQSSSTELHGHAWSSNIGWISFNCAEGGVNRNNICGKSNYKVTIDKQNRLRGWAWSSNVGWIKFGDTFGCPGQATCGARLNNTTSKVEGLARVCAATERGDCTGRLHPEGGGWDGWFSLNCTNTRNCGKSDYAVKLKPNGRFGGFAWGDEVVGWVIWSGVYVTDLPCQPGTPGCLQAPCTPGDSGCPPTPCDTNDPNCQTPCSPGTPGCTNPNPGFSGSISVNPPVVRAGETSVLTWSADNVEECRIMQGGKRLGDTYKRSSPGSFSSQSLPTEAVFASVQFSLQCKQSGSDWVELDSVWLDVTARFEEL